ncbi:MAG: hypothetical protein M1816_007336 [Peltula sp. TS41687]|nr:MAG: hypothetical protein M1816_007336 [Peltula sp. TS41687]
MAQTSRVIIDMAPHTFRLERVIVSSVSSANDMDTEETELSSSNHVSSSEDSGSSDDSVPSDHSSIITQMYENFDVKDMSKEEFMLSLAAAPQSELQAMIDNHAQSRMIAARSSSSEASSIDTSGSASSGWLDRKLRVVLSEIGHFVRHHPYQKDPLAIHTVSERRAYTRAVYDYARALGLNSVEAREVIREVRRAYRQNRHLARITCWLDVAAEGGRTMEDELDRIRTENGWDTDELEGEFGEDDEDLSTDFGTEIDDTVHVLEAAVESDELANDVSEKMSDVDASSGEDVQTPRAERLQRQSKGDKNRTKKRGRESSTDEEQAKLSKKTMKRTRESNAGNSGSIQPTIEGGDRIVEPSDHVPELNEPAENKRKRRNRGKKKKKGRPDTLAAIQRDTPEAAGSTARKTMHSSGQANKSKRRKSRAHQSGFDLPNDTPDMAGVEGLAFDSEGQNLNGSLGGQRNDGMLIFVPGAESNAESEAVSSSVNLLESNFSVVITHSSPPSSSTISEENSGGHALEDSGLVAPEVSQLQVTPKRTKKRVTPLTSPYFQRNRMFENLPSCIPFPSISQGHFGLIQEKLAHEPFKLLVAVTFLNRTRGIQAIPVFYGLMDQYPTPTDLAAADEGELASHIRHLGLQNTRARRYIQLAQAWIEDPPVLGRRHRKLHYPHRGDGKDIKRGETIDDEDERIGAWEIAHLPTTGPYAIDSWRIFCRDELRGRSNDNAGFEPEWKRVVPLDKELRAYLKWRWLKEGLDWNPRTGETVKARRILLERAERGELETDGEVDSTSEYNEICERLGVFGEASG